MFTARYDGLLSGTYDCVDRIVLKAFFPLGYGAGGLRTWWRGLHGDDSDLDDAHLMRMAGPLRPSGQGVGSGQRGTGDLLQGR